MNDFKEKMSSYVARILAIKKETHKKFPKAYADMSPDERRTSIENVIDEELLSMYVDIFEIDERRLLFCYEDYNLDIVGLVVCQDGTWEEEQPDFARRSAEYRWCEGARCISRRLDDLDESIADLEFLSSDA